MAIFFSLHGLPLSGRLSTMPVSRNFFNSLLTPHFVQLFQKIRLSTSLLCTPSNTNFFYQNLVLVAECHVDC